MLISLLAAAVALLALALPAHAAPPEGRAASQPPTTVRVERDGPGWRLLRDGKPYFIRGVGGTHRLEDLAKAGGNSIRSWSVYQVEPYLDQAHALGISVTVGLNLQHPRHGFDYTNERAVREQLEFQLNEVRRVMHHPAILMWGVGNEVELEARGDQTAMWRAINQVAAEIKKIDPNRPTMLVVAEVWAEKIAQINALCPDIDILGINSYGGMDTAAARAKQFGWTRPIVITEFGPRGWWEVPQTSWGVPIEPNSTEKADTYLSRYFAGIFDNPAVLGSYAFLWGQKQECTHTWFGMFLPEGDRLGAVDSMTLAWTGRWPANRAPRISSPELQGPLDAVPPGATLRASIWATDPEADPITFSWEVREESSDRRTGGDAEAVPPIIPTTFTSPEPRRAEFSAPTRPGPYRLFVYVRDPHGNAATANVPFFVKAPSP